MGKPEYELALANMEVRLMFEDMIEGWFSDYTSAYNIFIKAAMGCREMINSPKTGRL